MVSLLVASLVFVSSASSPEQAPVPPPAIVMPQAGELQQLDLKDGTRAIGRVEAIDGDQLTFRTTAGVLMTVMVAQVKQLGPVKGQVINGEFWPEDPNTTRLFFGPTGRTLQKGESYLAVYEILMPFVQYGITDSISIGGGAPFVLGAADVPVWVSPKVRIAKSKSTDVSLGVLHFFNMGEASVGIAYGVTTYGGSNASVTGGIGYAYARDPDDSDGSMVAMVGMEKRLSRRTKFVSENYIFDGGGILSFGVRLIGEKLSVDLGMFSPLTDDGPSIALPIINFVWKF